MEISKTIVYTKKMLDDYVNFHMNRGRNVKLRKAIRNIILGLCTAFGIFCVAMQIIYDSTDYSDTIVIIMLLVLLWVISILPSALSKKRNQKVVGTSFTYTFTEENLKIHAENNLVNSSNTVNYDFLNKIYEYNGFMYIYVNQTSAYLVDISKLSEEDSSTLRTFLKNKLGTKKYIECK